jgi:outer membrane protein
MTNFAGKTLAVMLFAVMVAASGSAQTRIATVDLKKVFESYWKTKQAEANLKDRAGEMEKQYRELTEDWKKQKANYDSLIADANNQALATDERDKRRKASDEKLRQLRDMETSINQFRRNSTEEIDSKRKRMRDSIVEEIRTVLNARAKAAGYAYVMDTSADSLNGTPIVLYNSGENDLTTEILNQLNASATDPSLLTTPTPDTAPAATPSGGRGDSRRR